MSMTFCKQILCKVHLGSLSPPPTPKVFSFQLKHFLKACV